MGSARRTMTRTTRSAPAPRGAARWGSACDLVSMGASRPTSALSVAGLSRGRRGPRGLGAQPERLGAQREGPTATGRSSSKGSLLSHSALSNFFQRSRPVSALQMSRSADLSAGCRRRDFRGRSARPPGSRARATPGGARHVGARRRRRRARHRAVRRRQPPRFALPAAISAAGARCSTPPPSGWRRSIRRAARAAARRRPGARGAARVGRRARRRRPPLPADRDRATARGDHGLARLLPPAERPPPPL